MRGSRGGGAGVWNPLENHKNIGFLRNTGQDPLKNHKATKPAFNDGPLYSGIWILPPLIKQKKKKRKKKHVKIGPSLTTFLDPRMTNIPLSNGLAQELF